ncbi:electron transport complex subunit RsxB [Peptococcaceae bacterium CEB3]|nr:electron transport complex subunit RsxB [Peptococcaceae bacterium CEB3]
MPNSVDVVLCHCQEDSSARLDLERLTEKLSKNKKISQVYVVEHLCSMAGTKKFVEIVRNNQPSGLVVGACAAETLHQRLSPCIRKAGMGEQTCATVPLRELILWSYRGENILRAARDLIKMAVSKIRNGVDSANRTARSAMINYLKCDKCKRCMEECPIGAYSLNSEGYPQVNQDLCQCCGICVGGCPIQCISLPDLRIEELSSEIRAIKGDGSEEPILLTFCCEPLTYPALMREIALGTSLPPNMRIIRVPCMGAVNAALINDALASGVDGVLLLGCEQGSCQIRQGDILAKKRLENLRETLTRMMFENERAQYLGWPEEKRPGIFVDPERCNGCLTCRQVCPFDAVVPSKILIRGKERLISERDTQACRSCGICAANCPSGACQPIYSSDVRLLNTIDAFCSNTVKTSGSDTAVLCNCSGKLEQYLDFEQLEESLYRCGFNQVLVEDRLCSEHAWQDVTKRLSTCPAHGVIAACAKDLFGIRMKKHQKNIGLEPDQWSFVDLWEKTLICPYDRSAAAKLCFQDVLAALAGLPRTNGSQLQADGEETLFQRQIGLYAETIRSLGPNPLKQ